MPFSDSVGPLLSAFSAKRKLINMPIAELLAIDLKGYFVTQYQLFRASSKKGPQSPRIFSLPEAINYKTSSDEELINELRRRLQLDETTEIDVTRQAPDQVIYALTKSSPDSSFFDVRTSPSKRPPEKEMITETFSISVPISEVGKRMLGEQSTIVNNKNNLYQRMELCLAALMPAWQKSFSSAEETLRDLEKTKIDGRDIIRSVTELAGSDPGLALFKDLLLVLHLLFFPYEVEDQQRSVKSITDAKLTIYDYYLWLNIVNFLLIYVGKQSIPLYGLVRELIRKVNDYCAILSTPLRKIFDSIQILANRMTEILLTVNLTLSDKQKFSGLTRYPMFARIETILERGLSKEQLRKEDFEHVAFFDMGSRIIEIMSNLGRLGFFHANMVFKKIKHQEMESKITQANDILKEKWVSAVESMQVLAEYKEKILKTEILCQIADAACIGCDSKQAELEAFIYFLKLVNTIFFPKDIEEKEISCRVVDQATLTLRDYYFLVYLTQLLFGKSQAKSRDFSNALSSLIGAMKSLFQHDSILSPIRDFAKEVVEALLVTNKGAAKEKRFTGLMENLLFYHMQCDLVQNASVSDKSCLGILGQMLLAIIEDIEQEQPHPPSSQDNLASRISHAFSMVLPFFQKDFINAAETRRFLWGKHKAIFKFDPGAGVTVEGYIDAAFQEDMKDETLVPFVNLWAMFHALYFPEGEEAINLSTYAIDAAQLTIYDYYLFLCFQSFLLKKVEAKLHLAIDGAIEAIQKSYKDEGDEEKAHIFSTINLLAEKMVELLLTVNKDFPRDKKFEGLRIYPFFDRIQDTLNRARNLDVKIDFKQAMFFFDIGRLLIQIIDMHGRPARSPTPPVHIDVPPSLP